MTKSLLLLPLAALSLSACQTLDPYGNDGSNGGYDAYPSNQGYPANPDYPPNQGYPSNDDYGDPGYAPPYDQPPVAPANPQDQPYASQGLAGTSWRLLSINGLPVQGSDAELRFDGAMVSGSAGCNQVSAGYVQDDRAISFGPARTTRMMCDAQIMGQERALLDLLAAAEAQPVGDRFRRLGAVRYAPNGNLILSTPDGRAAVLAPIY